MKPILAYYDELAENYDENRFANSYGRYVDLLERNILTEWLNADKNYTVDLGCGTGRLLEYAMTGVDGSHKMLQIAAKKFPDRTLIQANLTNIPLPTNFINSAICFHVLMHLDIKTIQAFFENTAHILPKGGRLIIDIPSKPRRNIGRRALSGWHGDTSASIQEVESWIEPHWKITRWRGILFFPIHRIPQRLRPLLTTIDAWLGKTWLAKYSSYYVFELERLS